MPAAEQRLNGVGDARLRPRLLRSLLRDRLPDEKRPAPSPAELSAVLAQIKTHGLLAEVPSSDPKLAEVWRAAVDAWVDRLLSLIDSEMPDKCWAGICLLGVTCEECSSERFLGSYSLWFQKLLSNLQRPSSSHFVKAAACASLADLLTRLASFPNVKKDATSLAGKLVQPVLQLLNEDTKESLWEGAVDVLCTILTFFSSTIHRHYDNVEAILAVKIMSGKCSANMSKKFACCLALLPKARGNEDSWSLIMQKVLISINTHLTVAFQGLEDESKSSEVMKLLVPRGKDPPPPLGGHLMSEEESDQTVKLLRELLVPRVSTLMQCCCLMLTNAYPIQVAVPIRALIALIGRVLHVDGSLDQNSYFTTNLHQELVCSDLPALHLSSLELLIAIIKGVKSQLLPHAVNVERLLTEYFRRATLPSIRVKVYSIMQILLISMGVGMALYLAPEVINNAFADLDDHPSSGSPLSSAHSSKAAGDLSLQSCHRKRKHPSVYPSVQPNGLELESETVHRKPRTPLSVKIAALRTLEALLTVGGSLQSECWRSNVDLLLITLARNACDAGWANEDNGDIHPEELSSSRADFQLAALQALLASLLSPAHVRPPYLSQGLELFRKGKQETGTTLAMFCSHALLALEVLIHPRALSLVDYPVAKTSDFDEGLNQSKLYNGRKLNMPPFSKGALEALDDPEDLYQSWLGNDEETTLDVGNIDMPVENIEQPFRAYVEDSLLEKHEAVNVGGGHRIADGSQVVSSSVDVDMAILDREENVAEPNNSANPNVNLSISGASGNEMAPGKENLVQSNQSDLNNVTVSKSSTACDFTETEQSKGELVPNSPPTLDNIVDDNSKILPVTNKGKGMMWSCESDSDSVDLLPDIVDADLDSD